MDVTKFRLATYLSANTMGKLTKYLSGGSYSWYIVLLTADEDGVMQITAILDGPFSGAGALIDALKRCPFPTWDPLYPGMHMSEILRARLKGD